jgi:hypothetical protein
VWGAVTANKIAKTTDARSVAFGNKKYSTTNPTTLIPQKTVAFFT